MSLPNQNNQDIFTRYSLQVAKNSALELRISDLQRNLAELTQENQRLLKRIAELEQIADIQTRLEQLKNLDHLDDLTKLEKGQESTILLHG